MLTLFPKSRLWVLVAGTLLTMVGGGTFADHADDMPHLLVMAAVSDNPRRLQEAMQPMATYMADKLAPLGIESIEVVIADSREQMVRLLREGKVDWVTETAFSATVLEKQAAAEILLRKWKQGVPEYQSLVFTRKDSELNSLTDLSGHSIAFQHPGSTTGYFQPASEIRAAGHRLRRLTSTDDRAEPGSVGFLFSGAEYNTVMWVHKGLINAGVLSSLDWQNDDFLPGSLREDFKVIHTSHPIPRALELVRGDLHPRIKSAMKQLLLSAHLDPDASAAMVSYHGTRKFDELDADALLALQKIRDLSAPEFGTTESAP